MIKTTLIKKTGAIIAILMVFGWISAAYAQMPLNFNGSFEESEIGDTPFDGIPGWNISDGPGELGEYEYAFFEIVGDPVQHGDKAMAIEVVSPTPGSRWHIQMVNNDIPTEPGFTYRFSAWAKAESAGATADFTVGYYNDFHEIARLGYASNPNEFFTEWERFSFQFTTDPDRDDFYIRAPIHLNMTQNEGNTIYLDNIQIIELAGPTGPVTPGETIVRNGDFSLSFKGDTPGEIFSWTFNGDGDLANFEIVEDPVFEGSSALMAEILELGSNPWNIQAINQGGVIEEGKRYRYSVWVKAESDSAEIAGIAQNIRFENYEQRGMIFGTEWTELVFDFEVTDDATELRAPVNLNYERNLGNTIYIDHLKIVEITGEETSADDTSNEVVRNFTLHQNYPNPFNPTTKLVFDLVSSEHVSLEVYDASGRFVRSLLNEHMPSGRHTVSFDATDLASGTYIYHIRAGESHQTRSMTLIK